MPYLDSGFMNQSVGSPKDDSDSLHDASSVHNIIVVNFFSIDDDIIYNAKVTGAGAPAEGTDRKSTRLNSSHVRISYAVFCLKKKKKTKKRKHITEHNNIQ